MEKCENFNQACAYLLQGQEICRGKNDIFFWDGKFIQERMNGNRYFFSWDNFLDLFSEEKFYVYREEDFEIDVLRDEEYYTKFPK